MATAMPRSSSLTAGRWASIDGDARRARWLQPHSKRPDQFPMHQALARSVTLKTHSLRDPADRLPALLRMNRLQEDN
jgi:hypothetical protein